METTIFSFVKYVRIVITLVVKVASLSVGASIKWLIWMDRLTVQAANFLLGFSEYVISIAIRQSYENPATSSSFVPVMYWLLPDKTSNDNMCFLFCCRRSVRFYNLLLYSLIIVWICLPQMGITNYLCCKLWSLHKHRTCVTLYHDWFGICLHIIRGMDSSGKRNRKVLYPRLYSWGWYSAQEPYMRYRASINSFPVLKILVSFMIHLER